MELQPVKQWMRDKMTRDPDIPDSPEKALKRLESVLSELSQRERARNAELLKAYTELHYKDRHDAEVPKEMLDGLRRMDNRIQRLKEVDAAREIVAKFGGPPSQKTIQESLARSAAVVSMEKTKTVPTGPVIRAHSVKGEAEVIGATGKKAQELGRVLEPDGKAKGAEKKAEPKQESGMSMGM